VKVKVNLGKTVSGGSEGNFRSTYLLVAGNDTVPISSWRVGGLRSAECRVTILYIVIVKLTCLYDTCVHARCELIIGHVIHRWRGSATGGALDLRSVGRGFKFLLEGTLRNNLGQVVYTYMCPCHQAVELGTGQRAVMLCGWEGNRRPGGK